MTVYHNKAPIVSIILRTQQGVLESDRTSIFCRGSSNYLKTACNTIAPSMAQDASLPMTPTRPPSSTGGDYRDDDAQFCVVDVPSNSIYASISRLLLNGQYSDMIIRCGGNDFRAHRAIVCPQSSFFDKALSGPFAVCSTAHKS